MTTVVCTTLGEFTVTIDGRAVPPAAWTRRHAPALVKVLALAEGRRLHREQLIDLLWPDDRLDQALPKLHKAAHFARRAIQTEDSVVLRDDHVALCPHHDVVVDVSDASRPRPPDAMTAALSLAGLCRQIRDRPRMRWHASADSRQRRRLSL